MVDTPLTYIDNVDITKTHDRLQINIILPPHLIVLNTTCKFGAAVL